MLEVEVYGLVYVLLMHSQKWQLTLIILTVFLPATAHLVLSLCLSLQVYTFLSNYKLISQYLISSLTGSLSKAPSSKKHVSNKVVVTILLLCALLTTLAFLFSLVCYFRRRDKCPIQRPLFLSSSAGSFNSATNLISHNTSSQPETKIIIDSPTKYITGKIIFTDGTMNLIFLYYYT